MNALPVVIFCVLVGCVVATPDLTIKNSCSFGLWAEARAAGNKAIPGEAFTKYVAPGSSVTYTVPIDGLASTRFWAKYGCDSAGGNCIIGDQVPNSSGQCPSGGCHAPVDSLFEATWGCKPGRSGCSQTTWFDTSQVDGWTLPYKVTLAGNTQCDCTGSGCTNLQSIDSSRLNLASCPTTEDLSYNNAFPQYKNQDLRIIKNGKVVGCKSPCKHMNLPTVQSGLGLNEGSSPTVYFCCPTPNPNSCQVSQGCITPDGCRAGPVGGTQYVQKVHALTDGVYAYSYDDLVGLHTCPSSVTYTMEYCPYGSAAYPYVPGSSSSSGTAATQAPSSSCGTYDTNNYVCTSGHLCPKTAPAWCSNGACYSTTQYKCCNGQLAPTNAC